MAPVNAYRVAGNAYQAQAVETATPAQLVVMLYDGALAAIARAERALQPAGSVETAHRELTKAQDIVTELLLALDYERGGDIAPGLAAIYQYCLDRLTAANVGKNPGPLADVSRSLADLREAWAHVADASVGAA